jgi:hypothetical protein
MRHAPSVTLAVVSDAADVVLAAGPSVVAVAALGFAAWQQTRGFRHEREIADLADVRSVIDDATVALHEADFVAYEAKEELTTGASAEPDVSVLEARLRAMAEALSNPHERLAVRLGIEHPVTEAFNSARAAMWNLWRAVHAIRADFVRGQLDDKLLAEYNSLSDSREDFIRLAVRTTGARLPRQKATRAVGPLASSDVPLASTSDRQRQPRDQSDGT